MSLQRGLGHRGMTEVKTGQGSDGGGRFLRVGPTLQIALDELEFEFTRASGPGGQHVNRTESAVQLRFPVMTSPSLPEGVRERLLKQIGSRLSGDGVLVITAQEYRSQKRNREAAIDRLVEMLQAAATPPKPRRATKPTRASKERRLATKRVRGETKRLRQGGDA